MIDVVRMVWFLYPKFQVSLGQTLVLPQLQYDIAMAESTWFTKVVPGK